MLATGVRAESITCPENTPSGTSCYQYTCGSNCTATLIGGAMTISGSGTMTNYSTTNMPWKEQIGSITSLTVQDGISNIGNNAFAYASNLTSVSVPNTLTNYGNYTFMGASSLNSINVPTSMTSIGDGTFAGTAFTSFEIPSHITSIGQVAFKNAKLTSITIPDGVDIKYGAFAYNAQLKSVTLPNDLTKIASNAFADTYSLTEIVIPDSVTSIEGCAFCEASNLKTVIFGENSQLTSIENNAFSMTYGVGYKLENLVIPPTVTNIDPIAFQGVSTKLYCTGEQISSGICDPERFENYSGQVVHYEKVDGHYNVYDSEGNKVAAYKNLADFGTNNVFKRTSYSPAEAAKHVNHTNNNKVIFTFK